MQEPKYQSIKEMYDLTGKTAIVTGGAMGLGFATAKRLCEAGASVVIGDMNVEASEEAIENLKESGYNPGFVKCNTTNQNDIDNAIAFAVENFGSLDILVNNAGIYPVIPFLEYDEEFWDHTFNVDLKAVFFFALKASKQMIKQKRGGNIINLSSVVRIRPMPDLEAYVTSKGGVFYLTKNLALELAKYDIRVNSITPGLFKTPGNTHPNLKEIHESMALATPMKRRGEPFEIGNVVLFLVSGAASFVTGIDVLVDGGFVLQT